MTSAVKPGPNVTAVVTGASSGIGTEFAQQLAARGWHVTLVARRKEKLDGVAAVIHAGGGQADVITCDLADAESRSRLVTELAGRDRKVAVLVNNAGSSTTGPIWTADVAAELGMVRADVEAVVHLCAAIVPEMVDRGSGVVINVASTAAFQPLPGQAGYGASKAFVFSYSQALHGELEGKGVSVTALCPGPVDTGFIDAAGFDPEQARKSMPDVMWQSAEKVARTALDAGFGGKGVVIPGWANAVSAVFAQHLPRRLLVAMVRRQHPAMKNTGGS